MVDQVMISRVLPVSTTSSTGAVAGEGGKQSQQVNRGYGMLMKKRQRILTLGRKISVLRVDATTLFRHYLGKKKSG
jgi:hypothetical protein